MNPPSSTLKVTQILCLWRVFSKNTVANGKGTIGGLAALSISICFAQSSYDFVLSECISNYKAIRFTDNLCWPSALAIIVNLIRLKSEKDFRSLG